MAPSFAHSSNAEDAKPSHALREPIVVQQLFEKIEVVEPSTMVPQTATASVDTRQRRRRLLPLGQVG
jgi:hypothetical protein